jgi:hypothetical protein
MTDVLGILLEIEASFIVLAVICNVNMYQSVVFLVQDGQYFLGVVGQEGARINAMCDVAETDLQREQVPDEGISCVLFHV